MRPISLWEVFPVRIAVCDDDRHDREQVLQALRAADPDASAECFSDGASLLEAARRTPPFDLVFLDIYMPGESGIQTAGAILDLWPRTGLVFITSSRDHAVDAFSLRALHYLVKPVTAEGVTEALWRLRELRPGAGESAVVTVGRNGQKVLEKDIRTLTSANHAVEILLADGQQVKVWTPLGELERKLGRSFLKINRGVIVNMDFIREMRADRCVLQDGQEFFLAVRERGAISAAYQDYLLDRVSREKKEAGL